MRHRFVPGAAAASLLSVSLLINSAAASTPTEDTAPLPVVQLFSIPSGSMEPTLDPGDGVVVQSVLARVIRRGDVVVFAKPANDYDPGVTDLVKRVIGLPGETIASGPDGEILIDGRPIAQPWLSEAAKFSPGPAIVPEDCGTISATACVIPKGDYFMMGDNRGDSADSRAIGPIPGKLFVGRVIGVVKGH